MDIDAPVTDALVGASDFGLRYPLPLRIVALSALTALGFASNLHLLARLGIDTAHVLDVRLEPAPPLRAALPPGAPAPYVHPSKLYPPVYTLALTTLAWTTVGWLVHRALTGAEPAAVVAYRLQPCLVALAVVAAVAWPANVLCRPYRLRFLRALARIASPALRASVSFSDIILADILTSSAKVLGDVWLAGCLVWTGQGVSGVAGDACRRVWGVPLMISLPYLFRFRQCLSEVYTRSTPTPRRSLLNALKYATAFPVIILSAMQTVIGDPFDDDNEAEVHEAGERWIGRTTLFNLWLLAVLVNSLYSFWWDVTNDWGLSLLTRSGWSSSPAVSYAFIHPPPSSHTYPGPRHAPSLSSSAPSAAAVALTGGHGRARSLAASGPTVPDRFDRSYSDARPDTLLRPQPHPAPLLLPSTTFPPAPSRPQTPLPSSPKLVPPPLRSGAHGGGGGGDGGGSSGSGSGGVAGGGARLGGHVRAFSTASTPNLSYPFLRPILLLPDPYVYYGAIAIDLLLRFTWSLKLSSHLHSLQEVESGVFAVEALEVVRRWMWVFLRIEWEAVRKGAGNDGEPAAVHPLGGGSSGVGSGGGAAGAGASSRMAWLDKGDGEARLRLHDEYELAMRGGGSGGGSGAAGGRAGPGHISSANGSAGGKGKGRGEDPGGRDEEVIGLLGNGSNLRDDELI